MNERPSANGLGREADVGEEVHDVGDRLGREHDRVVAGVERRAGSPSEARVSAASAPSAAGSSLLGVGAQEATPSRCPLLGPSRARSPARPVIGTPTSTPRRVRDRDRVLGAPHLARDRQPAVARTRPRSPRPRPRAPRRRTRAWPAARGRRPRPARARAARGTTGPRARRAAARTAASQRRLQRRVVEAVGARDAHALAEHGAHADDRVLLGDVLVDAVVGEARERAGRRRRRAPRPASAAVSATAARGELARLLGCRSAFSVPPPPARRGSGRARRRARRARPASARPCRSWAAPTPASGPREQTASQRRPELRRDAGVVGLLDHAAELAVLDLPADLAWRTGS